MFKEATGAVIPPEVRFCRQSAMPLDKFIKISYQGASANSEPSCDLTVGAVSSGQDSGRVQEGATTEVGAVSLQTDDEREVAGLSRDTTNDLGNVGLIPLRNRRRGNGRQSCEGNDERLGGHVGQSGNDCWLEPTGRWTEELRELLL